MTKERFRELVRKLCPRNGEGKGRNHSAFVNVIAAWRRQTARKYNRCWCGSIISSKSRHCNLHSRQGRAVPPLLPFLPVAIIALMVILSAQANVVELSTNLTEWTVSSVAWPAVLEMVRINPATPGKPHYYYRLAAESESSSATSIPQDMAWNYVTNISGDKVWWASVPTNWVQLSETTWAINNPAKVWYAMSSNTRPQYMVESSTNLTEWSASDIRGQPASDGFHAARQIIPPPPPAPIKERVTIGDPFFPIPSRKLTWDYDANFVGMFEIYWASNPSDVVQVGETTNRVWSINNPARRGWFGVRARTLNGYASKWATVPNLE